MGLHSGKLCVRELELAELWCQNALNTGSSLGQRVCGKLGVRKLFLSLHLSAFDTVDENESLTMQSFLVRVQLYVAGMVFPLCSFLKVIFVLPPGLSRWR